MRTSHSTAAITADEVLAREALPLPPLLLRRVTATTRVGATASSAAWTSAPVALSGMGAVAALPTDSRKAPSSGPTPWRSVVTSTTGAPEPVSPLAMGCSVGTSYEWRPGVNVTRHARSPTPHPKYALSAYTSGPT